jgi:hypothetical protein
MSVKAVDALDVATNKILELLEDPLREGSGIVEVLLSGMSSLVRLATIRDLSASC